MKIIVTGSEGFIGKHVVDRLDEEGHLVFCVDLKADTDILKPETANWLRKHIPKADFIINLAGTCSTPRSFDNPLEALRNNTLATFAIMQYARECGAKVIHTSSIKAQTDLHGMYTPYGLTKYFGELIAKEWDNCYDVPVIVNRPGTIYGPGQEGSEESGWLAWFITAAITGKTVTINGDGKAVRDPLYVHDYVDLLVDQINHFDLYRNVMKRGGSFNVGGGIKNRVSLNDAVKFIQTLLPLEVKRGPARKGDIEQLWADNWICTESDWEPRTFWSSGIEATIKWYQSKMAKELA